MATPQVNMRWPAAVQARVKAQAERRGLTFTEYTLEAVEALLEADESPTPAPLQRPAPAPKAPPRGMTPEPRTRPDKATAAREALAQAEARTGTKPARMAGEGVNMGEAMARAGLTQFGGKRPAYQKGQAGQGKAKR